MIDRVLVDTGPLVAIIRKREEAHARCVAVLSSLPTPFVTCWPVLTEAAYLLRAEPGGIRALSLFLDSGALSLIDLDARAFAWIVDFIERYASIGADLADAALIICRRDGHRHDLHARSPRLFGLPHR